MHGALLEDSSLSENLRNRVQSELRSGERLLWVGQPRPGRFARQAIPAVLFGIPWTAFALFWMAGASGMLFGGAGNNNAAPGGAGGLDLFTTIFPLFGLPFVLIGVGLLSSPFWMRRQAKRTCYAVTDRRAILWNAGKFGSVEVRSYQPEALQKLFRVDYADGCGDLVFDNVISIGNACDSQAPGATRLGFMAIDNVHEIEELLRNALLAGPQER